MNVALHAAFLTFLVLVPSLAIAAEPTLAIVQAGIQQSEDAPFVSPDFSFLPGEFVYFTFQVSGFDVQSDAAEKVRKISMTFQVSLSDARGLPLAPPENGAIETALNPEDKTWIPKRRVAFLIPSFVASGGFHVHVLVKDVMAKAEASKDFPFRIGGTKIEPTSAVEVENFHFFRSENEGEALAVPAFRPGDTVYARFDMAGYHTAGPQNEYHLSYGITVLRPDGKTFIDEPHAAELKDGSFYPAQFVPGNLAIKTSSDTAKGSYMVVLTIRDAISNQTYQSKQIFTLE